MSKRQKEALDSMLRRTPKEFKPTSIETMRANFAALMANMHVPANVRRSAVVLGGRPAILVEPEREACQGIILYFHGGSFALGSPETAMSVTANLVARTGIKAISLDYRLAPEHPFPAAIEDGVAAYRALLDDGHDASSIGFAGDSAGGGLSVTTTLAARAAGLPAPAAILAFSPGLTTRVAAQAC